MKVNRILLKLLVTFVMFSAIISSCKKEEHGNSYSYFVSKDYAVEYKKAYIGNLIDLVSLTIPDVAAFKPLLTSDVNVYKVVYRTTVDGKQINASGLICVPVIAGEYPVLSFQNGTNTVNASAPSEFPEDYTYQMIEILSSMGYVVVIADYPGFGESAQIPHPYLITKPTVSSLVDLLYTAKEIAGSEFPDITLKNEYYLLGYSQGGWATLALHKALELDYSNDFNLKGSCCGAGPYDILKLLDGMISAQTYPMPVYMAYILNAYTAYNQFANPVSDIFNEPYASRVSTLFNGMLTSSQINSQLTTSIPGLITADFISGFKTAAKYSSIRDGLNNNSITAWHSYKPLLLIHGGKDTQVNPVSTETMYSAMIQSGTSPDICKKVIVPDVDHGDGAIPCMIQGILFLNSLNNSN